MNCFIVKGRALYARTRSFVLVAALAAFGVLLAPAAHAQAAVTFTPPDLTAALSATSVMANTMISTYGVGLIGIGMAFAAFKWVKKNLFSGVK